MASFETTFSARPSFSFIFSINSTGTDTENNRSSVNFAIDVRSNGGQPTYSFTGSNRVGATVDGQGSQIFSTLDFRNRPAGTTFRVYENNITVNHNSDGTKTVSWNAFGSYSVFGSASLSSTFTLPTIPRAPNPPPSVTAAAPVGRSIFVSWQAASGGAGVNSYTAQRRENNGNWSTFLVDNVLSFLDEGLNPRSTYRYRVQANGPGGSSGFRESNSQTIAPAASTPEITATRTRRSVEVEVSEPASLIDGSTTIDSYTTERRQGTGAWGDTRTTTDLVNRSITYSDLPSETNQQFRGRVDTNFGSSDFSESQVIFIPGLPDPPQEVIANRLGASIFIILVAPVSDGGAQVLTYTVEKRISEDFGSTWGAWANQVIVPGANAVYLYDNLELQKTYQFRALATNEEGDSEGFTESEEVYLPTVLKIFEDGQFRFPNDYKKYDEALGWTGLTITRRYFDGEWIDLE